MSSLKINLNFLTELQLTFSKYLVFLLSEVLLILSIKKLINVFLLDNDQSLIEENKIDAIYLENQYRPGFISWTQLGNIVGEGGIFFLTTTEVGLLAGITFVLSYRLVSYVMMGRRFVYVQAALINWITRKNIVSGDNNIRLGSFLYWNVSNLYPKTLIFFFVLPYFGLTCWSILFFFLFHTVSIVYGSVVVTEFNKHKSRQDK